MSRPLLTILFTLCLFVVGNSPAFGSETDRVYLSSDQLVVSDYGIFVLLENAEGQLSKILVPQVNWDSNGLFVQSDNLPYPQAAYCRMGHRACEYCYRCGVKGCPSYGCRCK